MSYSAGFIYCTGLVFIVLVKPLNCSGRLTWPPGDFPFFLLLVGKWPNPLWGWGHNMPIVLLYASHFPCVWGSHPRGPSSLALTCEELSGGLVVDEPSAFGVCEPLENACRILCMCPCTFFKGENPQLSLGFQRDPSFKCLFQKGHPPPPP